MKCERSGEFVGDDAADLARNIQSLKSSILFRVKDFMQAFRMCLYVLEHAIFAALGVILILIRLKQKYD